VEHAKNGGCCNGQTGHHLVSGAAMEEACKDYDRNKSSHATAPTVCVEGTSQQFGSHKRVHEKYAETTAAATKGADGRMSMADTLDAAAESHVRAFPLSRCSKACILAQLKGHYDKHCENSRVLPGDKNGNPIKPPGTVIGPNK
jgi:GHH signature containing HNH/Endo VII superfamily nuclease toxin  2